MIFAKHVYECGPVVMFWVTQRPTVAGGRGNPGALSDYRPNEDTVVV